MSVVVLRTINCDQIVAPDCFYYSSQGSPDSASVIRARLAAGGWLVGRPGGEDICPPCVRHIRAADADGHSGMV